MRKFRLLMALFILFFYSCHQRSPVEEKIYQYIVKFGHNPDSYEPVSTTLHNTITERNVIAFKIDTTAYNVKVDSEEIEYQKVFIIQLTGLYSEDIKKEKDELFDHEKKLSKKIQELNLLKAEMDSLSRSLIPNNVSGYHYVHECRIREPLGGLMLKKFNVVTDKDFNILMFAEDGGSLN